MLFLMDECMGLFHMVGMWYISVSLFILRNMYISAVPYTCPGCSRFGYVVYNLMNSRLLMWRSSYVVHVCTPKSSGTHSRITTQKCCDIMHSRHSQYAPTWPLWAQSAWHTNVSSHLVTWFSLRNFIRWAETLVCHALSAHGGHVGGYWLCLECMISLHFRVVVRTCVPEDLGVHTWTTDYYGAETLSY